ncbi:MAG TPA: DUF3455 domain-containing protein [Caulobacteraceae bacterium]|nr:DUF3455 domain-containing protein [Caulobacteraceae bacterium]
MAFGVADRDAILVVHGAGAQTYECKAGAGGEMRWVFREPVATLLLQEDGSVNLCLSVPVDRLRLAGAKPETLVASLGEEASLPLERIAAAERLGGWSSVARM